MPGPLDGIRILDLTIWGQPFATAMLADMGAEVVKVEDFPHGDPVRGARASFGLSDDGPKPWWELNNRGKKSVVVSLRNDGARQILHRLAAESDVFTSNLSTDVLNRIGLDYDTLATVNPRIIYVLGTGWGSKGPDKKLPVMDLAAQARGGVLLMMEQDESIPPWGILGLADAAGAMQFAYAVALALVARERTGFGQKVDVSLLGAQMTLGAYYVQNYLFTGQQDTLRPTHKKVPNPLRSTYRTKDGRWISFSMLQADRHWPTLCKIMGIEHLENDPRFNSLEHRAQNNEQLVTILDQIFATKTKDEWIPAMREHRIIFGLAQNCAELTNDPQVLANDYVATVQHPTFGALRVVGIPVQLAGTPGQAGIAPELGQHTEEVLMDVGGYSWEELIALKERGVIL